jgi:S-formylglutathione hydrolase FrmB
MTHRKGARQLWPLLTLLLLLLSTAGAVVGQAGAETKAASVVTVQFESKLAKAVLPYQVLLPPDYESAEAKTVRYPVLYLLHGFTGHYTDWLSKSKLRNYAADYRIVIVTPEGNNGWYTDSATVPGDKYESYIMDELLPDVERRFRVNAVREGRAIAGLSMGGYGSLKFGVKHPEKFVFAGSLSGALDAAVWTEREPGGRGGAILQSLQATFGPVGSPVRNANDLLGLYRNVPTASITTLPYIYIDCGTEDILVASNRNLENILLDKKIPHEFRLLPGGHTWPYWDKQVIEVLRVASPWLKAGQEAR